ncbi:MAG: hypothetical protein WCL03_11820 [Bacteroidota bacterium]
MAQLTGVKTIKSSGGDYATFTDAITALNTAGVGVGGVTFNVDDDLVLVEDPPAITDRKEDLHKQITFFLPGIPDSIIVSDAINCAICLSLHKAIYF